MATALTKSLKVALIQLSAGANKAKNLANAKDKILEAASNGAKLVVLPECFNSPYAVTAFPQYSEPIPDGETTKLLSSIAKSSNIYLIGGSIPEKGSDGKLYNTNITFNPRGELIGKHRKVHLFDIDVPGKIKFKESEVLTGGSKATIIELEDYGKIGLGICYDIRFPELAAIAARNGAFAMVYPGAFNTTTGPLHWSLLSQSRAVDNQIFVISCSPSRDLSSSYHAYGHSLVVDPWGKTIVEAGVEDEILYTTLEPEKLAEARGGIPVSSQRRFDVYPDVSSTTKVSAV